MGKLKQIYTEVAELVDAVLNMAGDELVKGPEASEDVLTYEVSRWLNEMGWLSPTEAGGQAATVRSLGRSVDALNAMPAQSLGVAA